MDKRNIDKIKREFEFLFDKVLGILVYGSAAEGEKTKEVI